MALIISDIWGLGSVIIIFKHVRDYRHFKHFIDFLPETDNKHLYDIFSLVTNGHKLLANVKIIVHDSIESPSIFGFIKPVILLPNIRFSDDEFLGVFVHESTHYKFGHRIIKFIAEFICACFWWNPLFREMTSEIEHVLEIHLDKSIYKKIDCDQQKKYLVSIAKVASHITSKTPCSAITCSLVEEKNEDKLKQRFKMILDGCYQGKRLISGCAQNFPEPD